MMTTWKHADIFCMKSYKKKSFIRKFISTKVSFWELHTTHTCLCGVQVNNEQREQTQTKCSLILANEARLIIMRKVILT